MGIKASFTVPDPRSRIIETPFRDNPITSLATKNVGF